MAKDVKVGIPLFGWLLFLFSQACGSSDAGRGFGNAGGEPASSSGSGSSVDLGGNGTSAGSSVSSGASSGSVSSSRTSVGGTGSLPEGSGAPAGGTGSFAGSGGSGGISSGNLPPPRGAPDAFAGAPAYVSTIGRSAHNAGQSCMKSGCHGAGGAADGLLIGGTVYADYAGTIPAPGVEIRVLDMAGHAVSVYSGQNGNFYVGGAAVTFPAIVGARDGKTTRPMVTALTGTMRSCAAAGCHIVGGSPATGAYYPIHVP